MSAFVTPLSLPTHKTPLPSVSLTPLTLRAQLITAPPRRRSKIITVDPLKDPPPKKTSHYPRPVVILPGYGADRSSYEPLAETLRQELGEGSYVSIANIRYSTWIRTIGGRPVTCILEELHNAVQKARQETKSDKVTIVGHSAGGWIARIYLGDQKYPDANGKTWHGERFVHSLVCLGTPHTSREPVTRQNMHFVNEQYPGAWSENVRYINLAGDGGGWLGKLSYWITGGGWEGDGIVPTSVAFLKGSWMNVIMKDVVHSPGKAGIWYGDERVVRHWSRWLQ